VPLRSHGSLSLNWALMAAGLVDRVEVTIFPVITGKTGVNPIFQGAADFDQRWRVTSVAVLLSLVFAIPWTALARLCG
jgi:riboflavin biosynthesis pyrimidine reductase